MKECAGREGRSQNRSKQIIFRTKIDQKDVNKFFLTVTKKTKKHQPLTTIKAKQKDTKLIKRKEKRKENSHIQTPTSTTTTKSQTCFFISLK